MDRKPALARIWAAIQRLSPTGAKKARDVPAKGKSKMKRAEGATLDEIMAAKGWQEHNERGFVSILGSRRGAENRVFEERGRGAELLASQSNRATAVPTNAASQFPQGAVLTLTATIKGRDELS